MTEDTTMWDINVPFIESPHQLRVKKWSFSFWELISDPTGVKSFEKFCDTEFSTENLKFYLAVQEIKKAPSSETPKLVLKVFK